VLIGDLPDGSSAGADLVAEGAVQKEHFATAVLVEPVAQHTGEVRGEIP
jgi:hypothetical protein